MVDFQAPRWNHSQRLLPPETRVLGDIVNALWAGGKTKLDQGKSIGELGLKNDDVVEVKKRN